ncbi:hypothetical protein [Devosia sp.]|uniref:hypothetical protein n=1 Tax=Devosia sp. TaxID=1871048 RepID=UPI001B0858D9|nr:hypothetical protein [Devosia sp.]MBO9589556.1 hypothetical protein [Devosia sp.]
MTIRVSLSEQIEYMERHRDKGAELLKANPSMARAVDVSQAIVMTLCAYQAFEHEIRQMEKAS